MGRSKHQPRNTVPKTPAYRVHCWRSRPIQHKRRHTINTKSTFNRFIQFASTDEHFHSIFGVTEQEAIEHYTDKFARRINKWRKSRAPQMYNKYVKVPIVTEGIRLDTVMRAQNGNFIYCYTQTINTRPKLKPA